MTRDGPVSDGVFAWAATFLEELCAISSASGDVPGLTAVAERLSVELERFGLHCEIRPEPGTDGRGQPTLMARAPDATDEYTLLIGHLDTVLPAIPPERREGRLCGTGALDMKGGFAALLGALRMLEEAGDSAPRDLLLVGVPDEEIGGPISEKLVRDLGNAARAVLVLEPGALRNGAETIVTGRRGLCLWRLEARGRAAHSGLDYWQGRSALAAAATWAGAVQRISQPGDGPLVNVGRIVGGDSEFVQDLGEEHHFFGTAQRLNVVPDRCVAEGEVRFLALFDRDRTLERMRELAFQIGEHAEVQLELELIQDVPPMDPAGPGAGLAARLVEAAARDGWTLEPEHDRGGVSFPNFLPEPGAVPVLDGLGPGGDGMHTREEYVDLGSLRRRIALIAEAMRLVEEYSTRPPRP
jgi:glutamate carboxypeptidase